MSVRKFSLKNSVGDTYDLNGENGCVLIGPTGLGYSIDPEFVSMTKGFYNNVFDDDEPQGEIVGDLYFIGDSQSEGPYFNYRNFINWINATSKIEFEYTIPMGEELKFFAEVQLTSIAKSELNKYGALVSKVTFKKVTPWYTATPLKVRIDSQTAANPKRYSYSYPYSLSASSVSAGVELKSIGHIPGGLFIRVPGPFDRVGLKLIDSFTQETIGEAIVHYGADAGTDFTFASTYKESYVKIGDEDVSNYLDLPSNVFFKLPVNKVCVLTLEIGSTVNTVSSVTQYDYYRGV